MKPLLSGFVLLIVIVLRILQYLYPEHQVIAPELITDKAGNIVGLGDAKKTKNRYRTMKQKYRKKSGKRRVGTEQ